MHSKFLKDCVVKTTDTMYEVYWKGRHNDSMLCVLDKDLLSYGKYVQKMVSDFNDINVFVFGHSLGGSDGNVFNEIIASENVKSVVVYYHSEESNLHVYRSGGIYDEENTHEKTYGNLYDIK